MKLNGAERNAKCPLKHATCQFPRGFVDSKKYESATFIAQGSNEVRKLEIDGVSTASRNLQVHKTISIFPFFPAWGPPAYIKVYIAPLTVVIQK